MIDGYIAETMEEIVWEKDYQGQGYLYKNDCQIVVKNAKGWFTTVTPMWETAEYDIEKGFGEITEWAYVSFSLWEDLDDLDRIARKQ